MASPLGGAICVFRLSGPDLREVLSGLGMRDSAAVRPREMTRVKLISPVSGNAIDDALIAFFADGKSYTGEEVVEFFLHGSPAVANELIDALRALGCRQALPGEFSFRAVRNGKLTVSQAQAVAELIAAKNSEAVTIAIEKLEGTQQKFVAEIAEELRNLAAFGELSIDFSDQDIDEVSLPRLKERLRTLVEKLRRLESSFARGKFIQDGVKIAILGLPNAGKSSFFNQVLGEDRSIVSQQAGTTRDVIRETLTLKGAEGKSVTLRIEDTAGVRGAVDEVEKIGVERSLKAAREADLVLLLRDPTATNAEEWRAFLARVKSEMDVKALRERGNFLVVLTKKDLPLDQKISAKILAEFPDAQWVSNATGEGIHDVVEKIVAHALSLMGREKGEIILTRLDHFESVLATIEHLARGLEAPSEDLFAADVRQGLNSLGPVIGDTLPDDILGKIFSEFCIGK